MAHAINNDNPPEKKFSSDERKEENKNIDSIDENYYNNVDQTGKVEEKNNP